MSKIHIHIVTCKFLVSLQVYAKKIATQLKGQGKEIEFLKTCFTTSSFPNTCTVDTSQPKVDEVKIANESDISGDMVGSIAS